LQTTANTWPLPLPSGAIGMGVSQLVKEPHTCTCAPGASWAYSTVAGFSVAAVLFVLVMRYL
jgi:hypothetical protein